jgi:hypothetical protein
LGFGISPRDDVHRLVDRIALGAIDERFSRFETFGHDSHVVTPLFSIISPLASGRARACGDSIVPQLALR